MSPKWYLNCLVHFLQFSAILFCDRVQGFQLDVQKFSIGLAENQDGVRQEIQSVDIDTALALQTRGILFKNTRNNPNLVSANCREDIAYMIDVHGMNHTSYSPVLRWQQQMLDANGRLPAGILSGNLVWLGDYTQCLQTRVWKEASHADQFREPDFTGKFCVHDISHYFSERLNSEYAFPIMYTHGVCVPSTCTAADVKALVDDLYKPVETRVTSKMCSVANQPLDYDWVTVVAFMPFAVFVALMIVGTLYDVVPRIVKTVLQRNGDGGDKKKKKGNLDLLLMSCSAYQNSLKLLNTSTTRNSSFACLNAIRIFSLTLIVASHYVGLGLCTTALTHNPFELFTKVHDIWIQPFLYTNFAVESFFTMTGFLVTTMVLDNSAKQAGRFPLFHFYIHRIWRITPSYMMLVLSVVGPYGLSGYGPMWKVDPLFNETSCRSIVWRAPLYIDVYFEAGNPLMCLTHGWYLNVEMVLYFLSPIILYPLVKKHWGGEVILVIATFVAVVTTGVVAYDKNAENIFSMFGRINNAAAFYKDMYIKPWLRSSPFLVGMFYGYVYQKRKTNLKLNSIFVSVAWALTAVVVLSCFFGNMQHASPNATLGPSRLLRALNISVAPFAWSIAIGWMILACATGYGGVINSVFSSKFFVPLGRLSYCIYLVHLQLMNHFTSSRQYPLYIDKIFIIFSGLGVLIVTVTGAWIFNLIMEGPTSTLERILIHGLGTSTRDATDIKSDVAENDMLREIKPPAARKLSPSTE